MADENDGVLIPIGGDTEPFESALSGLADSATAAASAVNDALSQTGGVDQLTSHVMAASAQLGSTLPAAAAAATAGLAGLAPAAQASGAAADQAAGATDRYGQQLQSIINLLTAVNSTLEASAETQRQVAQSSEESASALGRIGEAVELAKTAAEAFIAVALVERLAELAQESVNAYGEQERLQTSLTLMGGSAEAAASQIANIDSMSVKLGLDQQALETTARRLAAAFGVGDGLTGVMTAAANASAATGRSFDTVSAGLERVQLTGAVTTRQLVALGISWADIARTMGVSVMQAQALLKKGGQDAADDVTALVNTINAKFGDAAAAQAKGVLGQIQALKSQLEILGEDVGQALAPAVGEIVRIISADLLPALRSMLNAWNSLPSGVQEFVLVAGTAAVALVPLAAGLATVGFAIQGIQNVLAIVGPLFASTAVAETEAAVATTAAATAQTAAAVSSATLATATTAVSGTFQIASGTATTYGLALGTVTAESEAAAVSQTGLASAMNTARGAATALGGVIRVGAYIAVAYEVEQLISAWLKYRDAVTGLAAATKTQDDTLAKLEISLRQQGIDTSDLSNQYHSGLISLEAYTSALGRLVVAYRDANPVAEDASAATAAFSKSVTKAVQDIIDKQTEATSSYNIAKAAYDELVQRLAAGTATQAEVTAAQIAMNKAHKEAEPIIKGAVEDLAQLQEKQAAATAELAKAKGVLDQARAGLDGTTASQNLYNAALEQYNTALKKVDPKGFITDLQTIKEKADAAASSVDGARLVYEQAQRAFAAGETTMASVDAAWTQLANAAKAAHIPLADATRDIMAAQEAAANSRVSLNAAAQAYTDLATRSQGSADSQIALQKILGDVEKAASALGISVTNTGGILQFSLTDKAKLATPALQGVVDGLNQMSLGADTAVIVNGKLTPTLQALADRAAATGQALGGLAHETVTTQAGISQLGDGATVAAGKVDILRGSANAAANSFTALDGVVVTWSGHTIDAATYVDNVNRATSDAALAATGYAHSLSEEATNLMISNDQLAVQQSLIEPLASAYDRLAAAADRAAQSISRAGGAHGPQTIGDSMTQDFNTPLSAVGGGNFNAAQTLSMYASLGVSPGQMDQIARALGLVVVGHTSGSIYNAYDTPEHAATLPHFGGSTSTASTDTQSGQDASSQAAEAAAAQLAAAWAQADATKQASVSTANLSKSVQTAATAIASVSGTINEASMATSAAVGVLGSSVTAVASNLSTVQAAAASVTQGFALLADTFHTNAGGSAASIASASTGLADGGGAFAPIRLSDQVNADNLAAMINGQRAAAMGGTMAVTVNAGTVVGAGGITQLATMVGKELVGQLRAAGLKIVGS